MWTWKRIPLYLAAVTCLLVGAAGYYERYQTFLREHHDHPRTKIADAEYCDILMDYRNLLRTCRPFNVFIHVTETHLRDVCGAGGYPYHSKQKRRSRKLFPLTICRLGRLTKARQCVYYTTFITRQVVLSCDEHNLPVHLDEVLTVST